MPATPDTEVAPALLAYLRRSLAAVEIDYAEAPVRVLGGYDNTIYSFNLKDAAKDWSGPLILRVLRSETDPAQARFEAILQSAIAEQGYPAPRPLHVCEDRSILGGAFMVMDRVPGRVMLDFFFRPTPMFLRASKLLAEAQAQLHAIDPLPIVAALDAAGRVPEQLSLEHDFEYLGGHIDEARLDGLRPAFGWLIEHRPPASAAVICHGDFHPINILIDQGAISGVVDWGGVRLADPAYDVGVTIALFKYGPVDLPGFAQPVVDAGRGWMIRRYQRAYEERRDLSADAVAYFEAFCCLGFLVEAGRNIQMERGIVPRTNKVTAFDSPRQCRRISDRIGELTGVAAALPGA